MSTRHPGRPGKTEEPKQCRADGCLKPANGPKGFCLTHYMYTRRGIIDEVTGMRLREQQRVAKYTEASRCIVVGCEGNPRSRGMCNKHMLQRQAGILDSHGNQLRELMPTGRKRERDRWASSTRDGYILIVAPDGHPHPRSDGSLLEHRHVVEQALGRYLEEWEIVHHKDGNRQNNCVENLELLDGRARKSTGHAPGSTLSEEQTKTALDHLRFNDPAAYARIIAGLP